MQSLTGRVHSVRLHVDKGQMQDAAELIAVAGLGFEGDRKAGRPKRQVLLADAGTIAGAGMNPGDLQEQITVELPALQQLPLGTRIEVGQAVLELTEDCEPCRTFAQRRKAADPRSFIRDMRGRRGMLAEVRVGGPIRPGDPVRVTSAD